MTCNKIIKDIKLRLIAITMKNLFLFVLLFLAIQLSAQNSTVIFRTDTLVSVSIHEPVDGFSNSCLPTKTMDLSPDSNFIYKLDLDDFGYIYCSYSLGPRTHFFIEKGDTVEIYFNSSKQKILFGGNNADGNQYFYDNYVRRGIGDYCRTAYDIFENNIDTMIHFERIDKQIADSCYFFVKDLDSMQRDGKITPLCNRMMYHNFCLGVNSCLLQAYMSINHNDFNDYKRTDADSLTVIKRIRLFMEGDSIVNRLRMRCPYFFLEDECAYIFKRLPQSEKDSIVSKYKNYDLERDISLMLAPEYMHSKLIGGWLASNTKYSPTQFNHDLFRYLLDYYPDSKYVPILQEWVDKYSINNLATNIFDGKDYRFINGNDIDGLNNLSIQEGIKGNYVYIDLWATWCLPCKSQFQYIKELHQLIKQYPNLVSVYISIDEESREKQWYKDIKYYNLTGFHLMASKNLYNDLLLKLNESNEIPIPRYILLDDKGNILNGNLPRPSSMFELKEVFEQHVKTKQP
jgi:thiol-disulfide isomerase/thioredoxin